VWLINIQELPLQINYGREQLSDSRKRLSAIISFGKNMSAAAILTNKQQNVHSPVSQLRKAYFRYRSQNQFPVGNAGAMVGLDLNGLSVVSSLQLVPHG
jgi:hypothetical protein